MIGQNISHYRILGKLGQGGMGVVYRALDTKLNRNVAIKVLPEEVAESPQRLSRFEREAKILASLNHPNIATIHGIEDSALVMELVEGPTLAERLRGGALPLEETVRIAAQIAEGLESAHERGVVHRDLKPANLKFTPGGNVKILDFGLAKAMETSLVTDLDPENLSTVANVSAPGVIMGTAAYMAPEQAAGRAVDKRADIWAFGVTLWEMLTGARLFAAESVSATLTKVLAGNVDFAQLPADTPESLRELLRRCLDRDEKARLRDIGEARYILRRPLERPVVQAPDTAPVEPRRGRRWWVWAAAAFVPMALFALAVYRLATTPEPAAAHRLLPFATEGYGESNPVWSPDGRSIAYTASIEGINYIFTRALGQGGTLRLTACPALCEPVGWSADGARVYYTSRTTHLHARIWSVGSSGGDPAPAFGEDVAVMNAAVSPDGKRMAMLKDIKVEGIERASLFLSEPIGSPPIRMDAFPVIPLVQPTYMAWATDSDQLLVKTAGAGRMFAVSTSRKSVRVVESKPKEVGTSGLAWPGRRYAVAAIAVDWGLNGLFWFDAESGAYSPLRVGDVRMSFASSSADGRRLAYTASASDYDLVEIPLNGSPPRPLLASRLPEHSVSFSPVSDEYAYVVIAPNPQIRIRQTNGISDRVIVTNNDFPAGSAGTFGGATISPDGLRVAYLNGFKIWISSTNGGQPVPMDSDTTAEFSPEWSPDGKWLAFNCANPDRRWGLHKVRVGSTEPRIKLSPMLCESCPAWSPDGKWIACGTDKGGLHLIPSESGEARALGQQYENTTAWARDSEHLYVIRKAGGQRELGALAWKTGVFQKLNVIPRDFVISNAYSWAGRMSLTREGRSLATAIVRQTGDIWILDGVRPPQPFWKRVAGWE